VKTVLFRADASPAIGFGHVSRCLAIRADLGAEFQCVLVTRQPSEFLLARAADSGLEVEVLPQDVTVEQEPIWISNHFAPEKFVLCLDGYSFDSTYQLRLSCLGYRLALVDDLVRGTYHADAILNHAEGLSSNDYQTPSVCRFYLGVQYAMIAPVFRPGAPGLREGWFVCLGGADPTNQVARVTERLLNTESSPVTVVLGAAYGHRASFETDFADRVSVRAGLSSTEMASLMQASKFGICSASTTALEYLSTGGVLGLIQTADNQKNIYSGLIRCGHAVDWKTLLDRPVQRGPQSVPRRSFSSLFRYLQHPPLSLRPAKQVDAELLLRWRNDEGTIANSLSPEAVTRDEHLQWFERVLDGKKPLRLWIAEEHGQAVGTGRSESKEGMNVLSWTVAPERRGHGMGGRLVAALLRATPRPWRAYVLEGNLASLRLAESFGFIREGSEDGVCIFDRR